jgi:hypothetical protein
MSSISADQYEPKKGGGELRSQPMRTAVHITFYKSQRNFGDRIQYLTNGSNAYQFWDTRLYWTWSAEQSLKNMSFVYARLRKKIVPYKCKFLPLIYTRNR